MDKKLRVVPETRQCALQGLLALRNQAHRKDSLQLLQSGQRGIVADAGQLPRDLRAQAVPDPGGDFLLRLEVVVDGSLGKAGGVNNVLQRCVGIALFPQRARRRRSGVFSTVCSGYLLRGMGYTPFYGLLVCMLTILQIVSKVKTFAPDC